jgi:mannose-6-phosphate isomerase-like protein (cupin superfamily)
MPQSGDVIENPVLGERVTFLQTILECGDGPAVRIRTIEPHRPHDDRPHAHATFTEVFEVLEGRARYRLGDQTGELGRGETISMPPHVAHVHPWNVGESNLRVRQEVHLHTNDRAGAAAVEDYLVTTFGLAREGRVLPDGRPAFLQTVVSLHAALPHVYAAGIPLAVQRILFGVLAPVARLAGYRPRYARFG